MWTAARDAHGSRWSSTAAALELAPSRHSLGTGARGTPPAAPDKIAGERSSVAGAVCCVSCRRAHSVVVTRRVRDHVGVMCSNVCPCRTALCPPTATMAAARVHPEQLSSMSEGPSQLAAAIKRGDAARALALLEGMSAPALLQAVECPWGGPFSRCPKGCSGNLRDDRREVKLDIPVPSPLPTWLSTFPERVPPPMRWPQHTCGARVNVGTDFWSVLVCTVAHCDVTYMDVYVVSRLTLDGTLVGECSFPSPSLC